ncbi:hypothetical protein TeGR_g14386 [Tetraparma gracilis]|jgi:hypothetical protein|uniref:Uncharacterized protein n=1 Tax=Tetraparma gracilis TaxID=2962635 RepID=A0ABQ6N2U3_9STRA|nr:hypothetical protein TeGR_g14386 [Tetraparma gracilis]
MRDLDLTDTQKMYVGFGLMAVLVIARWTGIGGRPRTMYGDMMRRQKNGEKRRKKEKEKKKGEATVLGNPNFCQPCAPEAKKKD